MKKTKKEISAGGIVFRKNPETQKLEWLIVQNSQHKGWIFPKGLVGDGDSAETKEKAALREVQEEGGIKAKILDLEPVATHYIYTFQDALVEKTVYYYLMQYLSCNSI